MKVRPSSASGSLTAQVQQIIYATVPRGEVRADERVPVGRDGP